MLPRGDARGAGDRGGVPVRYAVRVSPGAGKGSSQPAAFSAGAIGSLPRTERPNS